MTLPLSSVVEFVGITMVKTKTALLDRIRQFGWTVRDGMPDMRSLPIDGSEISAWVFVSNLEDAAPGQSKNFGTEAFATEWNITLIHELKNNTDPADTPQDPIIIAATKVLESLVATIGDVTLDSSVQDSNQLRIKFAIGSPSKDRNCLMAVISLKANHPLGPCRNPPGV